MARFSLTISSSSNLPMRSPTLVFGTVAILSTIKRDAALGPLRAVDATSERNSDASVSSTVKAQMVIESVASKLLS